MRTTSLLRKLGWRQSKGKWIADDHSRPLTIEQAKNALARDLKSKDFAKLKKSGKLAQVNKLAANNFKLKGGKFIPPKGRKPLDLAQASAKVAAKERKEAAAKAKELGFKSKQEQEKVADYYGKSDGFLSRFYDRFEESNGEMTEEDRATIQRLYYRFRKARTKRERQQALNDLLIFVGFRTGNEPYPAGQTPKSK